MLSLSSQTTTSRNCYQQRFGAMFLWSLGVVKSDRKTQMIICFEESLQREKR